MAKHLPALATSGALVLGVTAWFVPVAVWSGRHPPVMLADNLGRSPWLLVCFVPTLIAAVACWSGGRWWAWAALAGGALLSVPAFGFAQGQLLIWDGYDPATGQPTGGVERTRPFIGDALLFGAAALSFAGGLLRLIRPAAPATRARDSSTSLRNRAG